MLRLVLGDNMIELIRLVKHFRNAIDQAVSNNDFYNIVPFSRFPKGCCDLTCDLLAYYLLDYGIESIQINGKYFDGNPKNTRNHVWLLTSDNILIDITGDQFEDDPIFLNYNKPIWIGSEDNLHKLFKERTFEYNTNLNGEPNTRRRTLNIAYKIVTKYL